MDKWKDLQDSNAEPSLLDAIVFATGNEPDDAPVRHGFKAMKKIETNPTLQDWVDYLNKTYQWADDIGMNAEGITPALIELVLRTDGYVERKEQPK